jgi:hypothetical protein
MGICIKMDEKSAYEIAVLQRPIHEVKQPGRYLKSFQSESSYVEGDENDIFYFRENILLKDFDFLIEHEDITGRAKVTIEFCDKIGPSIVIRNQDCVSVEDNLLLDRMSFF